MSTFLFFFHTCHSQKCQQQQQQHSSNIILIRGARTENGQIILQNGHELLSLLNSGAVSISSNADDDKNTCNTSTSSSILLHRKASTFDSVGSKLTSNEANKFMLQSALKNTSNSIIDASSLGGNGVKNSALLYPSQGTKTTTTSNVTTLSSVATTATSTGIPEGSIILQQRLSKNGKNDRPILLQTLKRIDKSPSFLLFRNNLNAGTGTTTCTFTAANTNVVKTTSICNQITMVGSKDDDKSETKLKNKPNLSNIPLGTGK